MVGCIGRSCFSKTLVINDPQKKSKGHPNPSQGRITITPLSPYGTQIETNSTSSRQNISNKSSHVDGNENTLSSTQSRPVISENEFKLSTTEEILHSNGDSKKIAEKTKSVVENGKSTSVFETVNKPPKINEENSAIQSNQNGKLTNVFDTVDKQPVINGEDSDAYQSNRNTLESIDQVKPSISSIDELPNSGRRRTGVAPIPVRYDQMFEEKLPVCIKGPEDKKLIKTAIEQNEFINQIISEKVVDDVIGAMYNREVSANETIIKQGDKGSHMYISAKGKFQIIVKGEVVTEFEDVRVFGELAILYNAKRRATIKAMTAGRVWVLDSEVYQQIRIGKNIKEQEETMTFLSNNEILNVVGREALQIVANLLKTEFYPSGQQIVKQGDKGNTFYIIRAGTVTITKTGEGVVGIYKKGDCFGELALLEDDRRQATVTANPPGVECLTLARKEFIDHFGDVKKFKYMPVAPKGSIRPAAVEHNDISLNDLKIRKTLGVGGFGRVELVQHTKQENLVFALKYLKKVEVVAQGQQEHVFNEKNIQMACQSPFIVRLFRTYKDQKYIYFLMESCLGGDLWSLLQKQKIRRFEEKEARFICACVLEALDYLHVRGVVYRDLKPENLLIAANGYIKLTDFGFAKKISGKTYTFAGTPEYVAPEIVLNKGHDKAVDYWAFGAFVFEMLSGRTPFRTDDSSHMRTYNKILGGIDAVSFPSYINYKAKHLIEKLCRPVAMERLGMQDGGVQKIKSHKWFLGFDWAKLAKCEVPSPFKPKLSGPVDTKYFDQFKKDVFEPPDELSGWDEGF
ncbi:unnamed protein product [Phaedon cochleariae]|uniref:cGMP-dependent protein kinase n=1 Tax=Phaedon cochleariae TaxID=80249 RepID=A0A9P0GVQ8_PHACE|nr:unnamed protein product [Phaedon cochleariae]